MRMVTARRLCPRGIFLPVRMKHYAQLGRPPDQGEDQGRDGPDRVRGHRPSKFLAKLASDHGKPDGFVVLPPEQVTEFLAPLPVGRIWGVGAKGEQRLHALGTRTSGQLAALPERMPLERFGEAGRHVGQLAHGLDDRGVVPDRAAKSVSTETTFARDIGGRDILRGRLLGLVGHLASRLRHAGLHVRAVDVKVRPADFHTRARSVTIAAVTNLTDPLGQAAAGLFERPLSRDMLPVRSPGVGAARLARDPVVQRGLFDEEVREKQGTVDRAVGAIRGQFGRGAIRRGSRSGQLDRETRDSGGPAKG
jgi:DNA polymerase-4